MERTPEQVADLLPPTCARLLASERPDVQLLACRALADAMDFWEEGGVVLDPVAFEVIVESFVIYTLAFIRPLTLMGEWR